MKETSPTKGRFSRESFGMVVTPIRKRVSVPVAPPRYAEQ
jgi:hypothetical protein